jgi:hypothetical protein
MGVETIWNHSTCPVQRYASTTVNAAKKSRNSISSDKNVLSFSKLFHNKLLLLLWFLKESQMQDN